MYKRILLAYDGSLKGRAALREGALMAKHLGAQVFLLAVIRETPGSRLASRAGGAAAGSQQQEDTRAVLRDGVMRLRQLGFDPIARLAIGEPAQQIGAFAEEVAADLVVVGHHRQGAFERCWSGPLGYARAQAQRHADTIQLQVAMGGGSLTVAQSPCFRIDVATSMQLVAGVWRAAHLLIHEQQPAEYLLAIGIQGAFVDHFELPDTGAAQRIAESGVLAKWQQEHTCVRHGAFADQATIYADGHGRSQVLDVGVIHIGRS